MSTCFRLVSHKCLLCNNKQLKPYYYQKFNCCFNHCELCKNYFKIDFPWYHLPSKCKVHYLSLNFQSNTNQLTNMQNIVFQKIIKSKRDILVDAVCGSGKTLIILNLIQYYQNLKILYLCPRTKLVLDFAKDFKKYFGKDCTVVCGERKSRILTNVVCATTNQLARLVPNFDLIIFDEIDAFPFVKNQHLNNVFKLFKTRSKARSLSFSATVDLIQKSKLNHKRITLHNRYHNLALPIPILVEKLKPHILIANLHDLIIENRILIFVPSIKQAYDLYTKLYLTFNCYVVSSKIATNRKQTILEMFANSQIKILITTTLLERGVTYDNVSVIILNANDSIFNWQTLVQIAGRVNRVSSYQKGEVYFECTHLNVAILRTIFHLKMRNFLRSKSEKMP